MQLHLYAQGVANEINITDFVGGPSWCYRFMQCNHLSIRARTTICQKLLTDFQAKVVSFREFVEKPMGRSTAEKGLNSVNIVTTGHEKSHFTVVLGFCGDGSKLPPMVIFK